MDIQKLLKNFSDTRKLSGTILVAIGNEPICFENFGFADCSIRSSCSLNTQYLIASITKQFTAAAVLRALYDKARASTKDLNLIEQKVQENLYRSFDCFMPQGHEIWMGDVPKWASKVTIHHLLTHSSGLLNWRNLPEFMAYGDSPPEVSEMVSLVKDKELQFEPGSRFVYCNSGYLLLGELVYQLTGKPLGDYMEKTFFEPLNMASTVYATEGTVPDLKASGLRFQNLARGYRFPVCDPQPSLSEVQSYTPMQIPRGSGSLISTAPDLLKWNHALYGGKVIPDFLLTKMLAPHMKEIPMPWRQLGHHYGYGIAVTPSSQLGSIYCHHGGIAGFRSGLVYVPSLNLSIVSLTNIEEGSRDALKTEIEEIEEEMPSTLSKEEKTYKAWEEIQKKYPKTVENENQYNLLSFEKILLEKLSNGLLVRQNDT